jgi:DNA-directed RNA polymerase specialized sigma24 family protein
MTELGLIGAACRGDEAAFRALVAPHHAPLYAHCDRMLGSRTTRRTRCRR